MKKILYRPAYASVRLIECSPPSWMVAMVLEEKGCAYEERILSFERGEHRSPQMLALSPRGTIPVLIDGDVVLTESLAMLEYLDLAHPTPPLAPADLRGRARALDRLHASGNLKTAGMALFAHLMRGSDPERVPALRSAFEHELGHWERIHAEAPHDGEPFPCLADFAVFVYVATAAHLGLPLSPALAEFSDRMRARASVQQTWPETWTHDLDVLGAT